MPLLHALHFTDADLLPALQALGDAELDALDFGVIGIDADDVVRRYNTAESRLAGLSPQRVLGRPLFTMVAPCMNNFMVAHCLADASLRGEPLDVTIDYVLTLRMRPVKVKLRLLAAPGDRLRYVLVHRLA